MTTDPDPTPSGEAEQDDESVSLDKVLRTLARGFLGELLEILCPEVVPELDLSTAEDVCGKLFATFHKKGHLRPDVAIKISTHDGEDRFVIFHAEMEGKDLQATGWRVKMYYLQLALEYDDPPVISAVICRHGRLAGIEKRELVSQVGPWVSNRFYYLAFGLGNCLAEDYVDRPQPLAAALAAFMRSEVWDPVEQKLRCLDAIRRKEPDLGRQYTLSNVVETYVELDEAETARFNQALAKREEVMEMLMTWDEVIEQSKAEGVALGKAEGVALGKAEGVALGKAEGVALGKVRGKAEEAREAIVLVVRHLWRSVPDDLAARLDAIDDPDRLHKILERVLEARSPDEIDLDG